MIPRPLLLAALAAALSAAPALADPGKGRGPSAHGAAAFDCPPGLARKDPPCIPPGQARQLARGDLLPDGYWRLRDPRRYGLPPEGADWRYYVVRDLIVRADPETRQVLAVIGLVDALLN